MIDPTDPHPDPEPASRPHPGRFVWLVLLGLGVLTWPDVVERFVGLAWGWGDMRPVLLATSLAFGALATLAWWKRERVAAFGRKLFPTPRRLATALLIAGVSGALGLVAVELSLRALKLPFSESRAHLELGLSRFDEELGWVYREDQSIVQRDIPLHFDAMGARVAAEDTELDHEQPAVLFIGGSFTFGHGVPYEHSFVGVLDAVEQLPFEVVNLGVQAYGTDQALLRLKRHFHDFNTKLVVYTFITAHVARNEYHDRRVLYPKARFLSTKPRFGLRDDGTLVLEHEPVRYEDYSYSRIWARLQMARIRQGPPLSTELTRALIREMRDFAESNGAQFLVVNWVQDTQLRGARPWRRSDGGLGRARDRHERGRTAGLEHLEDPGRRPPGRTGASPCREAARARASAARSQSSGAGVRRQTP